MMAGLLIRPSLVTEIHPCDKEHSGHEQSDSPHEQLENHSRGFYSFHSFLQVPLELSQQKAKVGGLHELD